MHPRKLTVAFGHGRRSERRIAAQRNPGGRRTAPSAVASGGLRYHGALCRCRCTSSPCRTSALRRRRLYQRRWTAPVAPRRPSAIAPPSGIDLEVSRPTSRITYNACAGERLAELDPVELFLPDVGDVERLEIAFVIGLMLMISGLTPATAKPDEARSASSRRL